MAVVQVFAGTTGLSIAGTRERFSGQPLHMPVSEEMLGRVFDGMGRAIDGGPQPLSDHYADINGQPINPTAWVYPRDYIQTGISAIDGMNTLVMGQKLPLFSGPDCRTINWPPRLYARPRWERRWVQNLRKATSL